MQDIDKGQSIVKAEDFAAQQRHVAAKTFWQAQEDDVTIVNQLRAQTGLPPIVQATNGAITKRALRLVTGGSRALRTPEVEMLRSTSEPADCPERP